MHSNSKTEASWLLLKITYTVVPLAAGLDKFFNKITFWPQYLNPAIAQAIPLTTETIMYIIGIIEIIAGLLVLVKPRWGGYVVALWLTAIAISIAAMGKFYDIAIRDVAMAVGALVLAWLSEETESKHVSLEKK